VAAAKRGGERLEILDQHVVGEFLPHLFRKSRTALVVAQDAIMLGQLRRHLIPGIERAAELVQQHDRPAAVAGKRVVKTDAVGVEKALARWQARVLYNPKKRSSE
jgi:hypothetical protein